MLSKLRDAIHPLRRLLAWPFLRLKMSATAVGVIGIALAALAAISSRLGLYQVAFWLAAGALLTDLIDGEVARQSQSDSPEGNYLDAMGDRISECLLFLGLLPCSPNLTALALAGACLTSFAKTRCALVLTMDNRDWPGLGDYPDRGVLLLVAYLMQPDPTVPLVLLVLISWSCLAHRIRYARRMIQKAPAEELQPYLRGSARYQR